MLFAEDQSLNVVVLLILCPTASAKKKTDSQEIVKLKSKIEHVIITNGQQKNNIIYT